jgi:hypothetical protein
VPSPTEGQNVATPENRQDAALRPGPTTEPPLAVESREQLVYLLTQACELEQGVLCEYLFALYSLKRDPQDGMGSAASSSPRSPAGDGPSPRSPSRRCCTWRLPPTC